MKIPIDRRSHLPIYQQIRDRIEHLIQSNSLQPGDRLPSIRGLADTIQVNKLTVIEAYTALESDGLIYARPGSGYFVSRGAIATPPTESNFAPQQEVLIPEQGTMSYFDIYQTSIRAYQQGDKIIFSSSFSYPTGLEDLPRTARRALRNVTDTLFNYDFPQGQVVLRKQIAQLLIQQGFEVSPDDLIITNGAMQGISLAMRHYVQPGDWVIVGSPTYSGALAILHQLKAKIIGIPVTRDGMNLNLLAPYLNSHRPKLIYTISTLHNPTGITTSLSHRQELLELANHYSCPILEDNAYEGLNFGPVPPPIKAFDTTNRVIYLGTFSKTLMPGLRVGYMVVTGTEYQPLVEAKLLTDLHPSTVAQAIVSEYLSSGHYRRHLTHLRNSNLQRRNAMLRALEHHFPASAAWTIPDGGSFLWVTLPEALSLQAVCNDALARGVMVTSGSAFFPNQQGYPAMRLNFSQPIDLIETGIQRLGAVVKEHCVNGA